MMGKLGRSCGQGASSSDSRRGGMDECDQGEGKNDLELNG